MDTSASGALDYTSDLVIDVNTTLSGQVSVAGASTALTGLNTDFVNELTVGDIVSFPSGASGALEERRITLVTDATTATISAALTGAITNVNATRKRTKFQEDEEVVLVYKMPKDNIKTLLDSGGTSDTSFSFRKQITGVTTNASGVATFTVPAGQTFNATSVGRNYTLTIVTAGSGSGAAGDVVDITGSSTGAGTTTLTVTDLTILGNAATVELMATITDAVANQRTKTAQKMTTKAIAATLPDVYGENVGDKEISLSYADVYKLHAVYESTAIGTAPVAPALTITSPTGTFTVGEIITGSSSGATGRVIVNSPSTVSYTHLTLPTNREV